MKIVFLTSILASATSASAIPFPFAGLMDGPGTPTTLPAPDCGGTEKTLMNCLGDAEPGAFEQCFNTCLGPGPSTAGSAKETCTSGCAMLDKCADECGSGCKSELVRMVNCHLNGLCTCASAAAIDVSSIESFALNLAATLKTKKNLGD
mmetsp:Transcript_697/g.1179  ORF Transcript_697/g.1179 Transcript_697/m.1179 type:complete len:149 (+) Transcript_697:163-609(+)